MPLWVVLLLLVVVKLPIAALLLWIPLRSDEAMDAREDVCAQERPEDGDGGSRTQPQGPRRPHPRRPLPAGPRRGPHHGPHGSSPPPSPPRIRHGRERAGSLL